MGVTKQNRTYIVTGATGFLGQKLVRALVREGDTVILFVRGKAGVPFRDRVNTLFNFNQEEQKRVHLVDCDIEKVSTIRNNADFIKIADLKIDGIWHLAANLSFRSKDKENVHNVNFIGTQHLAKLAKELGVPLYYVSTAYVHGQRRGVLKEEELVRARFNNVYEESKFMTEEYLKTEKKSGLRYIVFRPGILIDVDETSGLHVPFGYYSILQLMHNLVSSLHNFIDTHKTSSRILGLQIDTKDILHSHYLPFIVANTSLNLVPIDNAIVLMLRIANSTNPDCDTFHIVSPEALPMRKIAEVTLDELKVKAPIIVLPSVIIIVIFRGIYLLSRLVPSLVGLSKKLHYYGYYMTKTYLFDTIQIEQVYGKNEYRNLFSNISEDLRHAARIFIDKQTS